MAKFVLILAACFLALASAQEFTVTVFGTDFKDCDNGSACDSKVKIQCQTNLGSWRDCGSGAKIQDDDFPLWPNRHIYNYVPAENMRWKFEIVDEDVFFDDHIHTFELGVGVFLNATAVGNAYRHDMNGRGFFFIHRRTL